LRESGSKYQEGTDKNQTPCEKILRAPAGLMLHAGRRQHCRLLVLAGIAVFSCTFAVGLQNRKKYADPAHMIPRELEPALRASLLGFPVVLLTGPRQSGKTTLVQLAP
jgi:hypothetical protein